MKFLKYTFISLLACYQVSVSATPVALDRIAVIVNNQSILQSDIDNSMQLIKANAKADSQNLPADSILQQQIIDKLIMDSLQQEQAERIGVKIDDTRLEQAIETIAKGNNQSVQQLIDSVTQSGVSYQAYRESVRKEVAAAEARNALVRRRINILPAEVDSLMNLLSKQTSATVQYKISHIQLRTADGQDLQQTEALAKKIIQQLNSGTAFNTLALTYSKGPKALKGGDWGWLRKEEMPTIFADQIKMQNKGTVIGPFRSGVGVHILKIDDIKGLDTVAVTEINSRHILIKPTIILSDEAAQAELKHIREQIQSGQVTFGDMAAKYSQDPGSASNRVTWATSLRIFLFQNSSIRSKLCQSEKSANHLKPFTAGTWSKY